MNANPRRRFNLALISGGSLFLFLTFFWYIHPSSSSSPSLDIDTYTSHKPSISKLTLHPKTYLPYTFGYAALLQTLHAYDHAEFRDIVVVDNSWDYHAYSSRERLLEEFDSLVEVIKTPVHLRFSQLMGMIDNHARDRGEEVYLWGHTDVIVLKNETLGVSPYQAVRGCLDLARRVSHGEDKHLIEAATGLKGPVGVMFFAYDLLSAVFTGPSASAPWDPAMPQYGSDCDRYRRIRIQGYGAVDCPNKIGEVVHFHGVMTREEKEVLWESGLGVEGQKEFLERLNGEKEQYAWRSSPKGKGKGKGKGGKKAKPQRLPPSGVLGDDDQYEPLPLDEDDDADDDTADSDPYEDEEEEPEELDHHDGITEADMKAAAAEGDGGRQYFEAKWGPFDCELGERMPGFDIARIEVEG